MGLADCNALLSCARSDDKDDREASTESVVALTVVVGVGVVDMLSVGEADTTCVYGHGPGRVPFKPYSSAGLTHEKNNITAGASLQSSALLGEGSDSCYNTGTNSFVRRARSKIRPDTHPGSAELAGAQALPHVYLSESE